MMDDMIGRWAGEAVQKKKGGCEFVVTQRF